MTREPPTVSVIIISFNTREITLECLRCLYADLGDTPAEVFVVDNASLDGSVAAIRAAYPQATVFENAYNSGFGAANNQAMRASTGRHILLLNSDAYAEPGAVAAMVRCMEANPGAAVVGPRLLNRDGSLQQSCFRFPSPLRCWMENLWVYAAVRHHPVISDYHHWPHDTERAVDFVIGACMLVRREAYEQVGGFDDAFFMYSEEIDWQRRMHSAGWQVVFTPGARLTHLGGASGATQQARIKRHFFDSLDYYEWKHHGMGGLVSVRLAMLVGCALRAVGWTAAMAVPWRGRGRAASKVRMHLWLCWRQLTHWRFVAGFKALACAGHPSIPQACPAIEARP